MAGRNVPLRMYVSSGHFSVFGHIRYFVKDFKHSRSSSSYDKGLRVFTNKRGDIKNAPSSILVTLQGISMLLKELQPSNAPAPIH